MARPSMLRRVAAAHYIACKSTMMPVRSVLAAQDVRSGMLKPTPSVARVGPLRLRGTAAAASGDASRGSKIRRRRADHVDYTGPQAYGGPMEFRRGCILDTLHFPGEFAQEVISSMLATRPVGTAYFALHYERLPKKEPRIPVFHDRRTGEVKTPSWRLQRRRERAVGRGAVRAQAVAFKKHLGKRAVDRNDAKRRLRGACRLVLPAHANREYRYLISARAPAALASKEALAHQLVVALQTAKLYVEEDQLDLAPPATTRGRRGIRAFNRATSYIEDAGMQV